MLSCPLNWLQFLLALFFFNLLKHLFDYLKELYREERERDLFHLLAHSSDSCHGWSRVGQVQKLLCLPQGGRVPKRGPSFFAFPRPLSRSCIRSGAARIKTVAPRRCHHCRWHLFPLSHRLALQFGFCCSVVPDGLSDADAGRAHLL